MSTRNALGGRIIEALLGMYLSERGKNILLAAAATIIMMMVAEVAVRMLELQPTYSRLIAQLGNYWVPSEYNTFTLKPGYAGTLPSMESSEPARISINSLGLRGPELGDDPKVLMLGDSYTFGVFVSNEETFPAVLEKLLRKDGYKYDVVNAGYADGFETDQQYVWLKHNIGKIQPKVVVLNVFLGNDILMINPDAWVDLDKDGLPSKWLDHNLHVGTSGILRNTKISSSTVGEQAIYRIPVLRDSHLCILIARAIDRIKNGLLRLPVGFHEESFQHVFGVYSKEFADREARFLKLVSAMNRLVRASGAEFAVTLLPVNFMVEREKMDIVLPRSKFRNADSVYYARLSKLLERDGIALVNIEDAMKKGDEGPFFPANGEVHFNRKGNAFTANKIYNFLRAGGYLDSNRS